MYPKYGTQRLALKG